MIQTKTFPNSSPPPENEGWVAVRTLRLRTVFLRRLIGTPRPNLIVPEPSHIKRFQSEQAIINYANTIHTTDETNLAILLSGLEI